MKSCLALVKDEDALPRLSVLIEEPVNNMRQENNANHVYKRTKVVR